MLSISTMIMITVLQLMLAGLNFLLAGVNYLAWRDTGSRFSLVAGIFCLLGAVAILVIVLAINVPAMIAVFNSGGE